MRALVVGLGLALAGSLVGACSDDGGEGGVASTSTSGLPLPGEPPAAAGIDDGCYALGAGDIGGVVGGVAVESGGAGADPYALEGARQPPGPGMATVPMAGPAVSTVVARPGDPDANSPAKQPPGTDGLPSTPTTTDALPPLPVDSGPTVPDTLPADAGTVVGGCLEVP